MILPAFCILVGLVRHDPQPKRASPNLSKTSIDNPRLPFTNSDNVSRCPFPWRSHSGFSRSSRSPAAAIGRSRGCACSSALFYPVLCTSQLAIYGYTHRPQSRSSPRCPFSPFTQIPQVPRRGCRDRGSGAGIDTGAASSDPCQVGRAGVADDTLADFSDGGAPRTAPNPTKFAPTRCTGPRPVAT